MRKFSFFLLLATAAAPVAAQDGERGDRRHRHSDSEQSESRPERAERAVARQQSQSEERRFGGQRSERAQPAEQGSTESIRERFEQRREQRQQQVASEQSGTDEPARNWRRRDGSGAGETGSSWQPREGRIRTIPDTQPRVARPATIEPPASVTRHRRDYRDGNYRRWTDSWRHDRRYDWRRYRDYNRSRFHLGFYYDPFGWNYRRWNIGSFLWPSYYGSRYWLNDPWHYRLPPAYGPYRWVRYWDDALLVNIYTGQVVDVIHNFFW